MAYGHEVHEACDGEEALEKLTQIPVPSLIFLDAMMPVMDGPTFFRELQKMNTHSTVPVVLFSAVDTKLDLPGVAARLRKPADLSEILDVVAKFCRS